VEVYTWNTHDEGSEPPLRSPPGRKKVEVKKLQKSCKNKLKLFDNIWGTKVSKNFGKMI
jgi:hypothetical protein